VRRTGRIVAKMVGAVVLAALLATAVFLLWPLATGQPSRVIIVSGHSMDPTFHTGDMIIVLPSDHYERGQVTPYRVPKGEPGAGGLVIHRIVGGNATEGFVMKGDNNPAPDIWTPKPSDIVGHQALLIPRIGLYMAWLRQPAVLAALVAGLITTFVMMGPGRRDRDDGPDDDGTDDTDGTGSDTIDLRDEEEVDLRELVPVGAPGQD
jgi:signal peptidase I